MNLDMIYKGKPSSCISARNIRLRFPLLLGRRPERLTASGLRIAWVDGCRIAWSGAIGVMLLPVGFFF